MGKRPFKRWLSDLFDSRTFGALFVGAVVLVGLRAISRRPCRVRWGRAGSSALLRDFPRARLNFYSRHDPRSRSASAILYSFAAASTAALLVGRLDGVRRSEHLPQRAHPPHASSRSRRIAGASGFFTLSQWLDRPRAYREPRRLVTMPSQLKFARVLEHDQAALLKDAIEHERRAAPVEELCQLALSRLDRLAAKIAAVKLD